MQQISPLAFVHPGAKLGAGTIVDPFVFIDEDVIVGENCHIRPHASLLRGTRMGNDNEVYEGAVIGAEPQDFRWKGDRSFVEIGNNNKIREHVIINVSIRANESTKIGNNSFIMAQTHIGHDSEIGDWCVIGNSVKVAGDCKIGNYCILSSSAIVHEHCSIGEWVLVKGGCRINGNVPPYIVVAHNPVAYYGVNAFILRRAKFTEETIDNIAKCYRHIYQCSTSTFNAVRRIQEDIPDIPERKAILDFLADHNLKIVAVPQELSD